MRGFIVVPPVTVGAGREPPLLAAGESAPDEMPDAEARAQCTQARDNHRPA